MTSKGKATKLHAYPRDTRGPEPDPQIQMTILARLRRFVHPPVFQSHSSSLSLTKRPSNLSYLTLAQRTLIVL